MAKQTKVLTRRRKFMEVEIPITRTKFELVGNSPEEIENKTIKLDLTRDLRGKSMEAVVKIVIENNKPIAHPIKIKLMPYFIRRMIRKRISYVEESFEAPSQESMLTVKPFLITRKKVSRAVRKTIRNKAKNWLEDYISQKTDQEIFNEILTNKLQKPLSLHLKKTYPLSLCEIRVLEIKRPLEKEEVPKKVKKKEVEQATQKVEEKEEVIDQMKELEQEKIKKAQEEIKKTQEQAIEKEEEEETKDTEEKPKKSKAKKEEKTEEKK
jgi:ribosomal protein S3AE